MFDLIDSIFFLVQFLKFSNSILINGRRKSIVHFEIMTFLLLVWNQRHLTHCRKYSIIISYKHKNKVIIKSKRRTTLVILQLKKSGCFQTDVDRVVSKKNETEKDTREKENPIHCRRLWRQTSFFCIKQQATRSECKFLPSSSANAWQIYLLSTLHWNWFRFVLFYLLHFVRLASDAFLSLPSFSFFFVLVIRTPCTSPLFSFSFSLPVFLCTFLLL